MARLCRDLRQQGALAVGLVARLKIWEPDCAKPRRLAPGSGARAHMRARPGTPAAPDTIVKNIARKSGPEGGRDAGRSLGRESA